MNLKRLQKTIEAIGTHLPPNDDWMPALILERKGDATIFGFVGDPMGGDIAKDVVALTITRCIKEFKPDCACFITTAWTLDFNALGSDEAFIEKVRTGQIRPSQHPDRVEVVNAYCYGERGESEGEALMFGYIQRFKDSHPKIKKWRIIEDDTSAEGRFPDAIKEGFKLARGG
jgi:hypothetical protein